MSEDNNKNNLDELLKNFKSKFINKPIAMPNNLSDRNPFKVNLSKYTQPKITKESQKKISKLIENTENIEKKILTRHELNIPEKKFHIDYIKELNESQLIAATSLEGSLLVIAGAGSGKTRTLTYRLAYMLENNISPENILLMTFTKKASNEMTERAFKLLNNMSLGNITSGTFHSFSNFILRKYYRLLNLMPNFTIADSIDSEDIIDLIRQELKFDKKTKAFPKKGRVQEIISKSRNCNKSIDKVIDSMYKGLKDFTEEIKLIAETFKEYKKSNNILDYDDLMENLRDSLRDNDEFRNIIQEKYKYIMVDEFQDTNPIQKEITDYIANKYKNIMVVGDDSQSIYGFRGAEVENILRFPETYPDCKVIKIEQNYRSSQEI
ncbi:MAG: ATP-dependent helicase, partial [Candidatus Sericytochromatia bacterium]